jgi:hypothetical protein
MLSSCTDQRENHKLFGDHIKRMPAQSVVLVGPAAVNRSTLARWLVDEVESGSANLIYRMPTVSRFAGSKEDVLSHLICMSIAWIPKYKAKL